MEGARIAEAGTAAPLLVPPPTLPTAGASTATGAAPDGEDGEVEPGKTALPLLAQ